MTANPNRITLYMTDERREAAQRLADRLTCQGVPGLLDTDGVVKHATLYWMLIQHHLPEPPATGAEMHTTPVKPVRLGKNQQDTIDRIAAGQELVYASYSDKYILNEGRISPALVRGLEERGLIEVYRRTREKEHLFRLTNAGKAAVTSNL